MKVRMKRLAFALLTSTAMVKAYAVNEGLYLGGQLGETNTHNVEAQVQTGTIPATVATTPSNTGFGGRLFGGYQFNPYAGLEMGYTHYAPSVYKPSITTFCSDPEIRENALDVLAKGILPIGNFGVFGKAGFAVIRQSQSGSLDNASGDCNSQGTVTKLRPALGIGASFDFSQNWVGDISWTRVMKGSGIQNADLYAIGISYHFVDKYCGQFLC